MQARSPTDRMVWREAYFARVFVGAARNSMRHFVDENEPLENFVRKQSPARGQADEVSVLLHQSGFDKLGNRGASVFDAFLAEFRRRVPAG